MRILSPEYFGCQLNLALLVGPIIGGQVCSSFSTFLFFDIDSFKDL